MKRILIVDDAATVRMYHRSILASAGYEVHEAMNGIEALEKCLLTPCDLYVVDINMPKLDGYAFISQLRLEQVPQAPVIMVSTESASRDELKAYRAGANSYFYKPVNAVRLLIYVRLLLGVRA